MTNKRMVVKKIFERIVFESTVVKEPLKEGWN
jgi:hypothetical protein